MDQNQDQDRDRDRDRDQMEGLVSTSAPEAPMHDAPLLSPSPVQHEEPRSTFAAIPNGAAKENGPGLAMAEPDAAVAGAATSQPPSAQPQAVPQPPSASSASSASAPAPSTLFTPASTPSVTPGPSSGSLPPRTSPLATQPPPAQYVRRTSMPQGGKVPIVEPPGAGLRRAASQNPNAFQSPGRDYGRENPKFNDDLSRLTHAVQQSVPEAVRRVTRDNWEKILLGTSFHQAFIMNAIVHHANGDILRRGISQFGRKMVSESQDAIMAHFEPADLDAVADAILDKASDSFLDKALERRLATIDARSLIDALARAERLGYESNDVNGDDDTQASPPLQAPTVQNHSYQFQQHPRQPPPQQELARSSPTSLIPLVPPKPQASLQCPLCWRKFTAAPPYEYHVKKGLCVKTPPNSDGFPFSCAECGAGFVTAVGQKSHYLNRVCGQHSYAPATPKAPSVPTSSPVAHVATNGPVTHMQRPASQMQQSPYGQQRVQPSWSTPVQKQNSATPSASAPPPSSGPVLADPYAHLNPDTRARLESDILAAEASYAPRFKEAESIADPEERKLKLEGLQNSFSTKQSIIRKRYGVRLRQRRTKEEIEAERIRLTGHTGTPGGGKRQRVDDGLGGTPSYVPSQQPQAPATPSPNNPEFPPTKHLSVTDMNSSGLGGSSATAATADPTVGLQQSQQHAPNAPPPRNSLAAYQQNGYRVDRHVSHSVPQSPVQSPVQASTVRASPVQASPAPANNHSTMAEAAADAPAWGPPSTAARNGSAAAPLVLDDDASSDSDSDGDGEIPAKLPPSG
ncbi:hypothetical protein PG994_011229 [Apiospora phragmitis]|uniref:C2H2-type domain-containing protein n=1 Tax=Apiospora phragmitis TaxID=2905665 RepID=A0ABR1TS76_9PEZI